MKRKNMTRTALVTSIISLLLCVSMLVGATFAWFTDSVTSANNIIKSGTLDVEMYWADGTKAVPTEDTGWTDASTGAIFNYQLWEPGYTEVRHIKIANKGNLALKYQLQIRANGEVTDLADVIDVYYADPAIRVDNRAALADKEPMATLSHALAGMADTANGTLKAGEEVTLTLALKMQESAGNEYQNKSIGSDFSVVLLATQLTAEEDSFDSNYDQDSLYPEVSIDNVAKGEEATSVKTKDESVKVDIPEAAPEGNYVLVVTDKNVKTDADGNTVASMDISLLKDGVKVSDGNAYTVSVKIGAGLNLTKLTHNGEEITGYTYDVASGVVTFTTNGFSPFSFTYKDGGFVAATATTGYDTLTAAFAEVKDGETITLLGDVAMTDAITNTKKVTLNLNGKTITGTDNATSSFGLITNKGELTITGNGKMTLVATNNRGWNAYSSVISNTVDGKLVIENGTIEHLGGTDMAYGIDNLTNGKGTYAETIINGGTVKSTYRAVRQFLNGIEAQNILTVNGGTIEGANKSIWMQDPSKNANTGKLTVSEKVVLNGDVYLFVTEGSTEWPVEVSIADKAVNGEVISGNVPEGYAVAKVNGVWTVLANTAVVETADELVAALEAGNDVIFANDIKIDPANMSNAYGTTGINVKNGQTIDGNGYTLDIKGAGGTWDSGISTTGGLIKNITITGSFRGIFINHNSTHSEKVVLENVIIEGVTYTISCDQGLYQTIEATNCTFNGWTSFAATAGEAKFINCNFGEGNGYAYCRPYSNTEFVNCKFSEGFAVDTTRATVTFTDCTGLN